jgi:hypothetical protein
MRQDYYAPYREHLLQGKRVEIGIPLSGGGVFRDWAVISESDEDELLAQISRDVLPPNVRIDAGFILDVTIRLNKELHTCSGIVVDKTGARMLRIRLFGDFTLRERRQFFRIDLDLRLKYAFVDHGSRRDVERDWEHRKNLEHMKSHGYDEFVIAVNRNRYVPVVKLEWRDMLRTEVNMSGGGICLKLPQPAHQDELLALEITIPLAPPRQVHAVAEVIHVSPRTLPNGDSIHRAGLKFIFLDERDRDLLFRHISTAQISVLRTIANKRDFPEPKPAPPEPFRWQHYLRQVLLSLLVFFAVFLIVRYLVRYSREGSPNEIQRTYDRAIKEYRQEDR